MAEIVSIRAGAFAVHMFLSQIHNLTPGEWRKLMALLKERDSNSMRTVQALNRWFPLAVKTARAEAEAAQADAADGIRPLNKVPHSMRWQQLKRNDMLRERVKKAKFKTNRLARFYDIFKDEFGDKLQ